MQCHTTFIHACALQAKFYARANINGTQQSIHETDRSSVSDGVRFSSYYDLEHIDCWSHDTNDLIKPRNAWVLFLSIFIFSNLLVLTSTLLNFRKVFLWLQEQKKQIKTLYKASATVLTCVNIIALISDLSIIISDIMQNLNSDKDLHIFISYDSCQGSTHTGYTDPRNASCLLQYKVTKQC